MEASTLNEKLLNDGLAPCCKCTEEEATTTVHVCQQCRRMKVCSTLLIDDYGNMVCTESDDEQQKDIQFARFMKGRRMIAKPDISDGEYWAWSKFVSVPFQECKKLNIKKSTNSDQAEAWEGFRDKHGVLQDDEFMMRDVLTGVPRHMVPVRMNRISKRTHPFSGCYDALFPYTLYQDRLRYHAPDTIVPVPLHINYLKGVFVPAMLQIPVDYRREIIKDTDKSVRDMDGIQIIGLQIAYFKMAGLRHADGLTEADLHAKMIVDKQKWLSGKPRRLSPKAQALIDKASRNSSSTVTKGPSLTRHRETHMGWTKEDIRRTERIIGQGERKIGRKVPRSQADNAPYPFHESSMLGNWDWPLIWYLLKERWERMTVSCNRKWETIDTMETLLLECIVQYLDADHKEFLGLPLVPFNRHPLRFSVAHLIHGTQMRTGSNNPHPTAFDDYEPHLNFDESLYDEMLADLATVNISKKWYDPDLARARGTSSEDDEELPQSDSIDWELEDVEMEDEYQGEFDSDEEEISGSGMEDEKVEEA